MRYRIADLCCGAGGAAVGLKRAFPDAELVGYDVAPQPRYPFEFVQADALEADLSDVDFVWASVPCQAYARTRSLPGRSGGDHPALIASMRAKLAAWGGPWIMENVERAPLLNAITLCGTMFGLRVYRHRLFEAPFLMLSPPHRRHVEAINRRVNGHKKAGYYTNSPDRMVTVAGHLFKLDIGRAAMGVDWPMSKAELANAVPPAYSEYLAQFVPTPA